MNNQDHIDVFLRLVTALQHLKDREPAFAERARVQAELYREMAIAEPQTLRRELERLHAKPGLSPDFLRSVLELALQVPPPKELDFPFYPPAQDLFHFIARGAAATSPATAHALLAEALSFDLAVLRAALIEALRPAESSAFENRARVLAEMLRKIGEDWYKPILQCVLALSFRSRGKTDAVVPQELGAVMARCRDSHDIPATLLRDDIRIIRNAVAHSHLKFDLDAQQLTFVNKKPDGREESLGPLSWDSLESIGNDILDCCWALALVCKRQYRLTRPAV
jgi:hypothetical protein